MSISFDYRGSLFDRLIDDEPYVEEVSPSLLTLNLEEIKFSIYREISWLLNSNSSHRQEELDKQDRTCVNYGFPDFSCLFPDSTVDRKKLSKIVAETISKYEPRLSNIEVEVREGEEDSFSISLLVGAELNIEEVKEPITFMIAM